MRLFRATILILTGTLAWACSSNNPTTAPSPASTPDPRPPAAVAATVSPEEAIARAAATITPEDMHRRVAFLASDELGGRDTPSPGLEKAAEYIAGEFRRLGLQPAGDSGSFIQRWPFESNTLDAARVSFEAKGTQGSDTPVFGKDFFVVPSISGSSTGALAFAGTAAPGRQPPGPEAAGKVVAYYVPGAEPDPAWNAAASVAVQGAFGADAAAVILVLDPQFKDEMIAGLAQQLGSASPAPRSIVGLKYDAAKSIFTHGLRDLDQLRAGDNRLTAITGTTVTVRAAQVANQVRPPNVVGILPGSDPALKDTYVVYSAHIDHVGIGAPDADGDSIYNGADDDASGTSTVLEVAEAFASLPVKPARSIIFLGVSGEEKGLLGSMHFAQHSPVPTKNIIADINIDMVGRNSPDTVVAIGQDYTSLGPLVQQVARAHAELKLIVAPDLWPEENLFVRSDHFSFARAGVPAIFFTTGLHPQYHRPSDEVELIDTDKLSRIGRLVFYLGQAVASRPDAPTWTEAGRTVVRAAGG
jgi:hypothetical protein